MGLYPNHLPAQTDCQETCYRVSPRVSTQPAQRQTLGFGMASLQTGHFLPTSCLAGPCWCLLSAKPKADCFSLFLAESAKNEHCGVFVCASLLLCLCPFAALAVIAAAIQMEESPVGTALATRVGVRLLTAD